MEEVGEYKSPQSKLQIIFQEQTQQTEEQIIQELEQQGLNRFQLLRARSRFEKGSGLVTNVEKIIDLYKAIVREKKPNSYRIVDISLSEKLPTETLRELYEQGTEKQITLSQNNLEALSQVNIALGKPDVEQFGVVVRVDENMPENTGRTNPAVRNFANMLRAHSQAGKIVLNTFSNNPASIPNEMKINNPFIGINRNPISISIQPS